MNANLFTLASSYQLVQPNYVKSYRNLRTSSNKKILVKNLGKFMHTETTVASKVGIPRRKYL